MYGRVAELQPTNGRLTIPVAVRPPSRSLGESAAPLVGRVRPTERKGVCLWVTSLDPNLSAAVGRELCDSLRKQSRDVALLPRDLLGRAEWTHPTAISSGESSAFLSDAASVLLGLGTMVVVACPREDMPVGPELRRRAGTLVEVLLRTREGTAEEIPIPFISRRVEGGRVVERVYPGPTGSPGRPDVIIDGHLASPVQVAAHLLDTLGRAGWLGPQEPSCRRTTPPAARGYGRPPGGSRPAPATDAPPSAGRPALRPR